MNELAVRPELRQHIAHIAVYRETLATAVVEHVVPDGAVRLMFDLGAGMGQALVAGPSAQPLALHLQGTMAGLTVTLRPGAAAELLLTPAGELHDRCLPLREFKGFDIDELSERLFVARDDAERAMLVQTTLRSRLAGDHASERDRTLRALAVLSSSRRTLGEASESVGVGERRLQQIFEQNVGLSPRLYRRLIRVHECLRALRKNRQPRWPQLALEHGFSDQAHLSREFRAFTGVPPTEFLARVSGSFKTTG
ncbi:MAG: helix-turn-helix domain-containing protein [Deltaproteobacteria bacterium]|nr:helix-turn-helix domain-containing protein [Deltaproteobacteria bacterium]